MKKILLLCSTFLIVLASCSKSSSDDAPVVPPNSSSILLKKFTVTFGGVPVTTDITYNGNKIVSSLDTSGTTVNFTYTGDQITKTESFDGTTLDERTTIDYNANGKLATYTVLSYTLPTTGTGVKETYVYNADGTTSYSHYTGDLVTQTTLSYTAKAFYTNGEITKIEKYQGANTKILNLTYDAKNNPFKNVTGYAATSFFESEPSGFASNIISLSDGLTGTNSSSYTTTYTYNSDNFPTTSARGTSFGTLNTQFFY